MIVGGGTMLEERLRDVSVIGAAGKMGSGISLLMLQEMTRRALEMGHQFSRYRLHLIDVNEDALPGLRKYLKCHLRKQAEKSINSLRKLYAEDRDVVSNAEVIDTFVEQALEIARFESELSHARASRLVFEAVAEAPNIKEAVYSQLNAVCPEDAFFLSNTSSIPISEIANFGGLGNRVIGFHFYNPAAVQKLVEVIRPSSVDPELDELATELSDALGKTVTYSHDIAGFIGNGFFIRELCLACAKVRELACEQSTTLALVMVNKVTQEHLVRPMGIFQLADYVGIDVCSAISYIMTDHIGTMAFRDELLDLPISHQKLGGQHADGSQKDGFFRYEGHNPTMVLDLDSGDYLPLESFNDRAEKLLGSKPESWAPWKKLQRRIDRDAVLANYFTHLFSDTSTGAELARTFLMNAKTIAQELVTSGVAETVEDVNTVMENGFYHLYGPSNHYY